MGDFRIPLKDVSNANSVRTLTYLVHDVLEGVRTIDSKAHEEQICLWV